MHKGETQAKTGQNPSDLFAFDQETRIECTDCHTVKYQTKRETMLIFAAPVSSKVEKDHPVSFDTCLEALFGDSVIDDFACGVCQKKTTCTKRVRFVTYP